MSASSKGTKLFNRAYEKAARGTPGHPARLTEAENELLLELIHLHALHCTEPRRPNCRDKGGYLRGKPWYGDNPEKARVLGLPV